MRVCFKSTKFSSYIVWSIIQVSRLTPWSESYTLSTALDEIEIEIEIDISVQVQAQGQRDPSCISIFLDGVMIWKVINNMYMKCMKYIINTTFPL